MNIVHGIVTLSYYDFLWYGKTAWTLFMGLWMPLSYMKVMNIDHARSLFIATSMKSDRYEQWSWLEAMNIDRYDHCSYWFMHECAVHAMKGYWSCMKNVDHSYEQALIIHDNVHVHVIMNIIVTPTSSSSLDLRFTIERTCTSGISILIIFDAPYNMKNLVNRLFVLLPLK